MALAFDAVTGANVPVNTTTSITFAHTVTGNETVLYVLVTQWAADQQSIATAVTYNGVSLTLLIDSGFSSANDRVLIFRLVNPSTGANNVIVTFGTAPVNKGGRIYSMSFTGARQTIPDGTPNGAVGSSLNPSVTQTAHPTDFIIDGVSWDATGTPSMTMDADTGRTQRGNAVGNGEGGACSDHELPPASKAMSWTLGASRTWAMASVNIHPSTEPIEVCHLPPLW